MYFFESCCTFLKIGKSNFKWEVFLLSEKVLRIFIIYSTKNTCAKFQMGIKDMDNNRK